MSVQPVGVLHNKNFVRLWLGQSVSMLGSSVTFLALPLVAVSSLNATPFQMGLLTTINTLPALLFGLFTGVWIDRYHRRPILLITTLGQAVLLSIVSVATLLGLLRMEMLYPIAFCIALSRLFFDVAYQSLLPTLVGRQQLVEGNSKLELSRSAVAVAGPSLAGGLIQLLSAPLAIIFDVGTFIFAALCIALIRAPESIARSMEQPQAMHQAIGAGIRLIVGNTWLRALTGTLATSALFTSMLDAVLLLYLTQELRLSPLVIGLVFACGSIGFIVGALLQRRVAQWIGVSTTLIVGLFMIGLGDLLIPIVSGTTSRSIIMLVLFGAQFCYGLGQTTFSINQLSLRQQLTPDGMQGRMNATIRVVSAFCTALGALLGGLLGVTIGLRSTLILAAIGEILTIIWVFIPRKSLNPAALVAE